MITVTIGKNNALVMTPFLLTRTRLDDNLDQMRAFLLAQGVTLETAMHALQEIKRINAKTNPH